MRSESKNGSKVGFKHLLIKISSLHHLKGTNFVKACALMEILESWTLQLKEDSHKLSNEKKWAWANEEWEQEWIQSRLQALANQDFKPTPPKGTNFVKACALMEILESWTLHLKEDSISFPTRKKWAWANEEWEQEWNPKSASSTC